MLGFRTRTIKRHSRTIAKIFPGTIHFWLLTCPNAPTHKLRLSQWRKAFQDTDASWFCFVIEKDGDGLGLAPQLICSAAQEILRQEITSMLLLTAFMIDWEVKSYLQRTVNFMVDMGGRICRNWQLLVQVARDWRLFPDNSCKKTFTIAWDEGKKIYPSALSYTQFNGLASGDIAFAENLSVRIHYF